METPNKWVTGVRWVAVVAVVLLLVQYLLGLWSALNSPAQWSTFDSSANYTDSLNWHITVAMILFVLGILAIVLAVLSKQRRLIFPAVGLLLWVFVAGEFGMAFVNASPNTPSYSFGMGVSFLLALFSAMGLMMLSWRDRMSKMWAAAPPAPPTPAMPGPPAGSS